MNWAHGQPAPRATALAILAVVIAIPVYACFFMAASFADAVSAQTDDTRHQLTEYAIINERSSIAEANLRHIKQVYGNLPYLLAGNSPAAATASLQDEVKALLEQNGGSITSAEAAPPERDGGLVRVTIRYSMSMPATNLPAFMAGLEAHIPFLFADDLKVTAADGTSAAALTIEVNLAGYCKVG